MAEVVTPGPAQGNVAAGAADSGDPVKIGGTVVGTAGTPPNYADGTRGNLTLTSDGLVVLAGLGLAADGSSSPAAIGLLSENNAPRPLGVVPMLYAGPLIGSKWARTPSVFKFVSGVTAAGNTAVWTPSSGTKFRLVGYQIFLSDQAKAGAAADLVVSFQDATTAIGVGMMAYVPTAITAGEVNPSSGLVDLRNGYLSATANNVLNVNLSFALTGGSVAVAAWGTEE